MLLPEKVSLSLKASIEASASSLGRKQYRAPLVKAFDSLPSTMDKAREFLPELNGQPLIVLAAKQTAGRGRQGRTWLGNHSGLYSTVVFSVPVGELNLSGFSLVIGSSIVRTLAQHEMGVQLKWPNDILANDGRKLAGVLIETVTRDKELFVLIGIGINLAGDLPSDLNAVTLAELGESVSAQNLMGRLYSQIEQDWETFKELGFEAFKEFWLKNYAHLNRPVQVKTGSKTVGGVAVGLDSTGALVVEEHSGQRILVNVGDVSAI